MTIRKTSPRRSRQVKVGSAGLVEIAESLFASSGLDVVSLRQVAASAGLSNPASVQFHFGSRENLIRAIWRKRLPALERLRAQRFAALMEQEDQPGVEALIDCAHRPFLEGFETFSQFLVHVLRSPHHRKIRKEFDSLSPVSLQIMELIRKQLPHLDDEAFIFRMLTGTLIVLDAIGPSNAVTPSAWRKSGKERAYSEAIAAAVGVMQAPPVPIVKPAKVKPDKGKSGKRANRRRVSRRKSTLNRR